MREKGQGRPEPGFGSCVSLEPGGPPSCPPPARVTGRAPCPVGSVSHWVVPWSAHPGGTPLTLCFHLTHPPAPAGQAPVPALTLDRPLGSSCPFSDPSSEDAPPPPPVSPRPGGLCAGFQVTTDALTCPQSTPLATRLRERPPRNKAAPGALPGPQQPAAPADHLCWSASWPWSRPGCPVAEQREAGPVSQDGR